MTLTETDITRMLNNPVTNVDEFNNLLHLMLVTGGKHYKSIAVLTDMMSAENLEKVTEKDNGSYAFHLGLEFGRLLNVTQLFTRGVGLLHEYVEAHEQGNPGTTGIGLCYIPLAIFAKEQLEQVDSLKLLKVTTLHYLDAKFNKQRATSSTKLN